MDLSVYRTVNHSVTGSCIHPDPGLSVHVVSGLMHFWVAKTYWVCNLTTHPDTVRLAYGWLKDSVHFALLGKV